MDVVTLVVVQASLAGVLAVAMAVFWRLHTTIAGLGLWSGSLACVSLALWGILLRGIAPDFVTLVLANACILCAPLLTWNGMRRYAGRQTRWLLPAILVLLTVAMHSYFAFVEPDLRIRVVLVSTALAAGFLACAWEVRRADEGGAARIAAGCYVLVALGLIARAIGHLIEGAEMRTGPMGPSPTEVIYFLYQTCMMVLTTWGLVVMASHRLHRRVERDNAELVRLATDLDAAYQRAEQASRAKSDFLATVSHELRTPLNTIIGFSDLALSVNGAQDDPARRREYFTHILDSGRHLLGIVNDILDLAKAEAGRLAVDPGQVALETALSRAINVLSERAAARGLEVTLAIHPGARTCWADERALAQILLNLLSNAVKFTPPGGHVAIEARPARGGDAAGGIEIEVRDDGVGIPPEEIGRILKPFEQIQEGYAGGAGGTGLGLPIVEALMRQHGGTLALTSATGIGTRALLWFPPPPEGAAPAPVDPPPARIGGVVSSGVG